MVTADRCTCSVLAYQRVQDLVLEQHLAQAQDDLRGLGEVVHGHGVQAPLCGKFGPDPAQLAHE
jgi:hypothetical protein